MVLIKYINIINKTLLVIISFNGLIVYNVIKSYSLTYSLFFSLRNKE